MFPLIPPSDFGTYRVAERGNRKRRLRVVTIPLPLNSTPVASRARYVSTAPDYIADVGRLAGSRTYEWAITTKSWIIMTFTGISIVSRCCILNLAGLPIVRVIPAPGYYAGCSGITKISGIVSTLNRDTNTSNFVFCHLKPKNIFCHSRSQDRPSRVALAFLIMLGAEAPVCTGF